MEATTKAALDGAVWIALAPAGSAVVVGLFARRLPDRLRLPAGALALLAGLAVAWIGLLGLAGLGRETRLLIPLAAVAAGLATLGLERLTPHLARLVGAAVGLLVLAFFGQRLLAPLAGVWVEGQTLALVARTEWAADALAVAWLTWLGITHAARRLPAPAVLGPIALSLAALAVSVALTGSASTGELAGASAVAVATVGLLAWRRPDLDVGATAGAAAVVLALTAAYAHFYVETPRPGLVLLTLAPLGMLGALGITRTLPAVIVALGLTALPAGLGVWLSYEADAAKQATQGAGPTVDEDDHGYN